MGGSIGRAKERERERKGASERLPGANERISGTRTVQKSDKGDFVVKRTCIAQ